jgi:hypothetical protein
MAIKDTDGDWTDNRLLHSLVEEAHPGHREGRGD